MRQDGDDRSRFHASFATPIGRCSISWSSDGVRELRLPGATEEAGGADPTVQVTAPLWVQEVMRQVCSHLGGVAADLASCPLDLADQPPFARRVYEELRRSVQPGETISYGELARRIGSPRAARAVGQALARNPIALLVPCHRVLSAGGRLTGFSAAGGTQLKAKLLALEAARSQSPSP